MKGGGMVKKVVGIIRLRKDFVIENQNQIKIGTKKSTNDFPCFLFAFEITSDVFFNVFPNFL
jgi:hypothetical protein